MTVIDEKPDPNISTFRPLDQMINSNIKYNGNGYMPCNGYVPCQVTPFRNYFALFQKYFVSRSTFVLTCWQRELMEQCPAIITRVMENYLKDVGDYVSRLRIIKEINNFDFLACIFLNTEFPVTTNQM